MMQGSSDNIIIAGASSIAVDSTSLRIIRGPFWGKTDLRFFLIVLFSILAHILMTYQLSSVKIMPAPVTPLEKLPERFARLIIDKPLPVEKKETVTATEKQRGMEEGETVAAGQEKTAMTEDAKGVRRQAAKEAVAKRAARVEQKMRTVGVLGLLTGAGTTARGPSVVDVLGAVRGGKERIQDLEKALDGIKGLQKAENIAQAESKLVKSKDVALSHTQTIDHLISDINVAAPLNLAKKGTFIIEKPASIEGVASLNVKRDEKAIHNFVNSKKTSILMSYTQYLRRYPGLEGKITIRFTIAASGSITSVEILENTTGSKELERDIVSKMKMWRFEAIPEGDATVTYPFVFRPS